MQGNPFAAVPMSAGGAPVPGVPFPSRPAGVAPGITQSPAAPVSAFPAGGGTQPNPFGTYGQPLANPFAPPVYQTPGPATLGSNQPSAGGVAGVSMAQVPGVTAPSTGGGPHQLPGLPQMPLPQGFPNPFQVQQLPVGQGQNPGSIAPLTPGSVTTTGPQGYMPGIGQFGSPGGQPAPGPAPQGQLPPPQAMPSAQAMPAPPVSMPAMPAGMSQATQPGPQRQGEPHPFWQQLAWQLTHSPLVKEALGDGVSRLVEGPERMRVLGLAAACLTGEELQAAFRSLSAGTLDQRRFIESFANSFKRTLLAAGVLTTL